MRYYWVFLFLLPGISFSETSLWKISGHGNELYLGGTIHVLKKEDYPLPAEYEKAFVLADKVVIEANIEQAKTLEFGNKITRFLSYPPGQSLKTSIKKETYNKLKQYLAERNIPIASFDTFKPQMIVISITALELKNMGMTDVGVDEYFHSKAKNAGKATGYFETIDEQIEFLRTMGQGNEDSMLLSTIQDMAKIKSVMNTLKTAWVKGDVKTLVDIGLTEMIREHPATYRSLLVNRNNNWMPRITEMLKDKKVELVLVGALHLVGKEGLLQQLRNKGYTVQKFR